MIREILCRLGLHLWKYPLKSEDGTNWAQGVHRFCRTCQLEQTRILYGGWDNDFGHDFLEYKLKEKV